MSLSDRSRNTKLCCLNSELYTRYAVAAVIAHSAGQQAGMYDASSLFCPEEGLTTEQSTALEHLETDIIMVNGIKKVVCDHVTQTYVDAAHMVDQPDFSLPSGSSQ